MGDIWYKCFSPLLTVILVDTLNNDLKSILWYSNHKNLKKDHVQATLVYQCLMIHMSKHILTTKTKSMCVFLRGFVCILHAFACVWIPFYIVHVNLCVCLCAYVFIYIVHAFVCIFTCVYIRLTGFLCVLCENCMHYICVCMLYNTSAWPWLLSVHTQYHYIHYV